MRIEARSHRIGFATHNFWVLAGADSVRTIAELHGLATSRRTDLRCPLEHPTSTVCAYVFPHEESYAESLGVPVKFTRMFSAGRMALPRRRWAGAMSAAVAAIPLLNELDLDYPPYGFNIFGLTVIKQLGAPHLRGDLRRFDT